MQRKSVRDDFYEQERYANQELRRFRANYPENAALIQNYVEDACDRMDYEGSRMYDEYPDRYMLKKNCASISNRIKKERDDGSGSRICEKVSESSKGNFR